MKKLVIILGASGNLGGALVDKIIKDEQVTLIGIDKNKDLVNDKIDYLQCDLGDLEQIQRTVKQIDFTNFAKVVIISSVGLFGEPSFKEGMFQHENFYKSIMVNLVGVTQFVGLVISECLRINLTNVRVVIVGSTAANVGSMDFGYGIAKAGLNGLVQSLSKSLAEQGIVAIGVNPGIFASAMSSSVSSTRQNRAIAATHIKRIGQLNEIANFVVYAAMEAPDYLTGSLLSINGGQYS